VPRGKCGRLVEKKEFGPPARAHQLAPEAAKLEPARDPAPDLPRSNDAPLVVDEDATIAEHSAAPRQCRDLAERRYAILKRQS